MEQKTPLYEKHLAAGGRMVPFAGWLLPVQYSGVIEEHLAVRDAAGLFDVSHMGEVLFSGPGALAAVNHLFTNDFTSLPEGKVRYSLMCTPEGGIVDDLIVYRVTADSFFVVVNAANREKDVAWMAKCLDEMQLSGGVPLEDLTMEDVSDDWAQLALQGPRAPEILAKLAGPETLPAGYYTFREDVDVAGVSCLVSRTGYTGENGYELYCAPKDAPALWDALLEAGEEYGLLPCGLGARDTLRFEAAMPLYGHELTAETTPYVAGLGFAVKPDKADFIGKEALAAATNPTRVRVGLKITGRGIAREHCPIFSGEKQVGETTSGTHCPSLGGAYAMAYLPVTLAAPGTSVEVEVRERRLAAEVTPLPFRSRPKIREKEWVKTAG